MANNSVANITMPRGPVSAANVYAALLTGRHHWYVIKKNRKTVVIETRIDFTATALGDAIPCCPWRIRISRDDYARLSPPGPAFTDISTITEYGLTQRLSNTVRVF